MFEPLSTWTSIYKSLNKWPKNPASSLDCPAPFLVMWEHRELYYCSYSFNTWMFYESYVLHSIIKVLWKGPKKITFSKLALPPPPPTPPLEILVSQNFFCCSQNLPKHILVLKKLILRPLFTVYRHLRNVKIGDATPPFLEKVKILIFWGI